MEQSSNTRRWTVVVAGALAVVLLAVGCKASDSSGDSSGSTPPGTISVDLTNETAGQPKAGGKLAYGLNAESDGYNPALGRWAASTYIVGFSMMDPLAAYDDKLQPQPYLAKSIVPNADFTQWTITARDGVSLHDGKPVDAKLIATNLTAQKASPLTGAALDFMESATVPAGSSNTVIVKMNKPWSTFPHILTAQVGTIASEDTLTPAGSLKPVGSGPFIFEQWTTGKNLTVRKNPNYWRKGFPYLDNIEFIPLPDPSTRGNALQSGSVNIFETSDAAQILDYTKRATEKQDGVQIFTDKAGDGPKIFIGLNTTKEPFNDPIARQAVAYSGDVVLLSEQGYENVFPPAYGPFSPSSPFFTKVDNYPTHNLEKAKALAQQYQEKHGKPLAFSANITPDPAVGKVAQVLQQQAAEAGIQVSLNSEEQVKLIVDALTGNYQATGFILFGSPHLDREYVFVAAPPKENGQTSLNFTRNGLGNCDAEGKNCSPNGANDKIVAAMDKARTTSDFAKQKEQYDIVQREMANNLNFLFLVQQANAVVYDKNVHGAKLWQLPDENGQPGLQGYPNPQTMVFNLWLSR